MYFEAAVEKLGLRGVVKKARRGACIKFIVFLSRVLMCSGVTHFPQGLPWGKPGAGATRAPKGRESELLG